MADREHRTTVCAARSQELDDDGAALLVEAAGGFVREDKLRPVREYACDGDALAVLSAMNEVSSALLDEGEVVKTLELVTRRARELSTGTSRCYGGGRGIVLDHASLIDARRRGGVDRVRSSALQSPRFPTLRIVAPDPGVRALPASAGC